MAKITVFCHTRTFHEGLCAVDRFRPEQSVRGAFYNFIVAAPFSTNMSHQGKFTCIMFPDFKCGTLEDDTQVLNFTLKLSPDGTAYDDVDYE